jgi:inorganic triphosphatase YgiF
MNEVELKFQVLPAQRREVDAAVAGDAPSRRVRLQAAYVDTPDRLLAAHGMALRLRREGRAWVQTLKGAADDGMTRLEHNVACGHAPTAPEIDPARHAATALGARLARLLAKGDTGPLVVLYRTDILRRTRLLPTPHGKVELAFDEGWILAGEARLAVCELEIELRSGTPLAVLATARDWSARHGVWLDARTKAERGDLLSRGLRVAPPCRAAPVALERSMGMAAAWQRVLRACAEQIVANASQIASGDFSDEHVHQLRVGLRRLRSAWQLFDAAPGAAAETAAVLFRALGAARDRAVLEAEFATEWEAAWKAAWLHTEPPGEPATAGAWLPEAEAAVPPPSLIRDPATQTLLLDLIEATLPGGDASSADLLDALSRRIARWHRRAVAEARHFAALDDAARHALRKRIKRLRYAVDFSAALFPRRDVRRYLRALRVLQERLGAVCDVSMAISALTHSRSIDPRAAFALGWLSARRRQLSDDAEPDLHGFIKAPRFWKAG